MSSTKPTEFLPIWLRSNCGRDLIADKDQPPPPPVFLNIVLVLEAEKIVSKTLETK